MPYLHQPISRSLQPTLSFFNLFLHFCKTEQSTFNKVKLCFTYMSKCDAIDLVARPRSLTSIMQAFGPRLAGTPLSTALTSPNYITTFFHNTLRNPWPFIIRSSSSSAWKHIIATHPHKLYSSFHFVISQQISCPGSTHPQFISSRAGHSICVSYIIQYGSCVQLGRPENPMSIVESHAMDYSAIFFDSQKVLQSNFILDFKKIHAASAMHSFQ